MENPAHGEVINDGEYRGMRWCEIDKVYHGILYPCEHYPENILKEIEISANKWFNLLNDKTWVKEIEGGMPVEVIEAGTGNAKYLNYLRDVITNNMG